MEAAPGLRMHTAGLRPGAGIRGRAAVAGGLLLSFALRNCLPSSSKRTLMTTERPYPQVPRGCTPENRQKKIGSGDPSDRKGCLSEGLSLGAF